MNSDDYVPTTILHDFAGRLTSLDIDYMLTGSMAMIRYTVFRQTADIDVVLDISQQDAVRIINEFERDYYVPVNAVRSSIISAGMFNLINLETAFKVDCIVKKNDAFSNSAFSRRNRTDYYGGKIWTISKEDLIISKLQWAKETLSEMQTRDTTNLMRSGFDAEYVERWVAERNLQTLYDQCVKVVDQ